MCVAGLLVLDDTGFANPVGCVWPGDDVCGDRRDDPSVSAGRKIPVFPTHGTQSVNLHMVKADSYRGVCDLKSHNSLYGSAKAFSVLTMLNGIKKD